MPGKTAKSAPLPPFGLSGMTALVRAATLSCENAGKSQKMHERSGVIRGIPGIGLGCLFDPSFAHRLAAPIRRTWVPLLFFVGPMAIIIGASELVGTDGITALIYIMSGVAK